MVEIRTEEHAIITLATKHDSSQPEVLDLSVFYPDFIQHDLEKYIMSAAAIYNCARSDLI
jgi:hypothetical protein